MTADQRLIDDTIRREGGTRPSRRHQADPGGWTRAGITQASGGDFLGLGRPALPAELDAMTIAQIRGFWEQRLAMWDWLTDPIRALAFDWSATNWIDDPIRALQASWRRRGVYAGDVDGIAGPLTREAALHDPSPRQTYRDLWIARDRTYHARALEADRQMREFLRTHQSSAAHNLQGWHNRNLEFLP